MEVLHCKEVRFRPRLPISWNYNDHDFSEIKYQMTQQQVTSLAWGELERLADGEIIFNNAVKELGSHLLLLATCAAHSLKQPKI